MLGKGMTWFWCPKVYFNPLPVHPMLITSRIFLVWLIFFLLLISSFSPSISFHLALFFYLYIFSIFLCLLFFFLTPLFSLSSFSAMHILFSFLICHPISYCLNYELHIQSLSGTFSDCLSLVLWICVLFKGPRCLLKGDWIFQGISFLWTFTFRKKKRTRPMKLQLLLSS